MLCTSRLSIQCVDRCCFRDSYDLRISRQLLYGPIRVSPQLLYSSMRFDDSKPTDPLFFAVSFTSICIRMISCTAWSLRNSPLTRLELGWAGLRWAGLGWAGLGCTVLFCGVLCMCMCVLRTVFTFCINYGCYDTFSPCCSDFPNWWVDCSLLVMQKKQALLLSEGPCTIYIIL